MVTLFFLSRLRMIARFLAVVNCLYGAGEIFVGLFILFAIVSGLTTPPSCLRQATVSRGRDRAAPLPTHLLRICAGALKWREQCAISKFAGGKEPTSSRQGILVCGALRLPHDLICLPLLFPQNSLRDFCRSPERQESAFSPPRRRQNMEFYKVRKRFLAPSRRRREKTFVRYARRRVDRFHAPECLRAFPPSHR